MRRITSSMSNGSFAPLDASLAVEDALRAARRVGLVVVALPRARRAAISAPRGKNDARSTGASAAD